MSENTLLLNEGIPRAYRGKKLRLKNILFFPSKSEGIYPQILMEVPAKIDLEGNFSIFFRRSFFPSVCPRYALGMPSFNNSVLTRETFSHRNYSPKEIQKIAYCPTGTK